MNHQWKVEGLTKRYRNFTALNQVSTTLQSNEITGLLGINGAGKSTLIKCMLNFSNPDEGSLSRSNPNGHIGYLPEITQLPDSLSAYKLIQHIQKIKCCDLSTKEVLDEIGLDQQAWRKPLNSYSKGMRQRTAIAAAMVGSPSWLILDEPMSGLDALGRKHVLELLKARHKQHCGIFICSHIVPDLVRLCDRILIMAKGEIQKDYRVSEHSMSEAQTIEKILAEVSS